MTGGPATGRPGAPAPLADPGSPAWDELLAVVLDGRCVRTLFQPIVDLRRRRIAGYEALTRFDPDVGAGPDRWFAAAFERGLVAELEAVALRAALSSRPDLPPNTFLSVNVEPESLGRGPVLDAFASSASSSAADDGLGGVVIEVTEHRRVDLAAVTEPLDRLRAAGALVAVDDAGAGYASLQRVLALRPAFVKLDRALVADVEGDEARAALVELLGRFADRIDARLLAEGVETPEEARRLRDLGVPLAQGFHLGPPAPPWADLRPSVRRALGPGADEVRRPGLRRLVQPARTVPAGDVTAARQLVARFGGPVVLLDRRRRPVGVVTAEVRVADGALPALRADVATTPAELAARLSTRPPADTAVPALVTDEAGRYLGIVTLPRLLAHLGGDGERRLSRRPAPRRTG